jgi:hypothetical protein
MRIVSKRSLASFALALSLCLVAALPAFASAATVTLHSGSKIGTKLANGTAVKALSSSLKFGSSAAGYQECLLQLNGTVENNGTEQTGLNVTSATFSGFGGTEQCPTNVPDGKGGFLSMVMTAQHLPWVMALKAGGSGSLTGTGSPSGIRFTQLFESGHTPIATCVYEAARVVTSFNFNTALVSNVAAGQVYNLVSGAGCPPEGTMTGSFSITTATGGTIVATSP